VTGPSTVTNENGGSSSSTVMAAQPVRRSVRPFTVSAPVVNTMLPSSSTTNQTGATCGRPSFRVVPRTPGRGGSESRKARTSSSAMRS
jgi:hypothetical protein